MKEKNKKENIENYIKKYKTDKKFKAKVQLIGGTIFIIVLIIYLNIESMNTKTSGNITTLNKELTENKVTETEINNKKMNLLEKIDNNYEYEIKAIITNIKDNNIETKEVYYYGKTYKNNMEITKKIDNNTTNYYKIDNRYYTKTNDTYELASAENIYDIIEKEYIELNDIKEYIDKSSLDHVTEYSSGKKEYVYHLKVKDIIRTSPETDKIEINITAENNILTIKIDYTKLIKEIKKDTEECTIEYTYKNIGAVEEFTTLEIENKKEENQ